MKLKIIVLLHALYPLYAYGACEALFKDMVQAEVIEDSETGVKYKNVIDEYIKKYRANYRPELFFDRALAYIEKTTLKDSGAELNLRKDRAKKFLSEFYHFDDSIKQSLTELAEHKFSPAFYCLGFVHERGIGTKVNHIEAWAWFMTAFAVDGINAKTHLTRVWQHLNTPDEVKAKLLADKYIRDYTEISSTPSVTIIQ